MNLFFGGVSLAIFSFCAFIMFYLGFIDAISPINQIKKMKRIANFSFVALLTFFIVALTSYKDIYGIEINVISYYLMLISLLCFISAMILLVIKTTSINKAKYMAVFTFIFLIMIAVGLGIALENFNK